MKTNLNAFLFGFIVFALCACHQDQKTFKLKLINPPFKGVDVPFEEFTLQAEKGDTIYSKSGSILVFPSNSMVDKNGALITGKVTVKFREFNDVVDYFVAGIPMQYDSAGVKYLFQSASMCEINAFKDNVPVYVNKNRKPQISLASNTNDPKHNLYVLDTVKKAWVYKGKDLVFEEKAIKDESKIGKRGLKKGNTIVKDNIVVDTIVSLLKPIKPEKHDEERAIFSIKLDTASFPELSMYKNLKFEVDKEDKTYKPTDADEEWNHITIAKAAKAGLYWVTFRNKNRKVSYLTKPVFKGKDFDEALKVFEKKEKAYEADQELIKQMQEYEKTERMKKNYQSSKQQLVETSKLTLTANKNGEDRAKRIAYLKSKRDSLKASILRNIDNASKDYASVNASNRLMRNVLRNFEIESFGYWNCDISRGIQTQEITAHFTDKEGKKLELPYQLYVVYAKYNSLNSCKDNQITILPQSDNMLWSVVGSRLVYLNYADFRKCNIPPTSQDYTFAMQICQDSIVSSAQIRKIVGLE